MRYEIINLGDVVEVIKHTDNDGNEFFIPKDEKNVDYIKYLEWKNSQEKE